MGTSKGEADVEYETHSQAEEAIKKLNNGKINEEMISVEYAKKSNLNKGRRGLLRQSGAVRKIRGRGYGNRGSRGSRRQTDGRKRSFSGGRGNRRGRRTTSTGKFSANKRTVKFKSSLGRSRRGRKN